MTALPPGHANAVQVAMDWGGFLMEPLSPSETRVSAVFKMDPKLAVIPHWFMVCTPLPLHRTVLR